MAKFPRVLRPDHQLWRLCPRAAFPTLATVIVLVTGSGCSVSHEPDTAGDETPGEGSDTCKADGEIPCYDGKAEPCDAIDSGFAGDEYCLRPPDRGWQLHVGPQDYDDPVEMEKFVLPAGAGDVNWCYQLKSPNEELAYTGQYYSHMRPGSHHFILIGLAADAPDSTEPGDCSARSAGLAGGTGAGFLAGATRLVQDAAMFGDAPEDEGLAWESPPRQQLSVNLHFVNVTDEPRLQELWVNQILIPEGTEVKRKIKAMTWLGGLGMNIAPGAHVLVPGGGPSCQPPEEIRIQGVTAHNHASTVRTAMYMKRAGDAERQLVFEDYNWEEPTVFRFNSKIVNSPPDPVSKTPGSPLNGVLTTAPGDEFSWECEIVNERNVNLTFSDLAYDGEMCNVFGMYSATEPKAPWACRDLRGGEPL